MINSNTRWVDEHAPELKGKILATLSIEGCIPELKGDAREANTRGGLGIYFGDKLEGLSAIGMDRALGCMPIYSKRLVQLIRGGRQHIEYRDVSYDDQPIEYVMDRNGKPLQFDVWGWDDNNTAHERQYHVDVYGISREERPFMSSIAPRYLTFFTRTTRRIRATAERIAFCRRLLLLNAFTNCSKV